MYYKNIKKFNDLILKFFKVTWNIHVLVESRRSWFFPKSIPLTISLCHPKDTVSHFIILIQFNIVDWTINWVQWKRTICRIVSLIEVSLRHFNYLLHYFFKFPIQMICTRILCTLKDTIFCIHLKSQDEMLR